VGIVIVNNAIMVININAPDEIANITSMQTTFITGLIMIMFAFFGAGIAYDLLFEDFKTPQRWRMLATPVSLSKFVFSNMAVSMFFSLITSALIFLSSVIIFDTYIPNMWLFAATMFIFTLFAQLLGMLLFLLVPKKGTAEAILQGIVWGTHLLSGDMFGTINLGSVGNFIFQRAAPNAIAMNIMVDNIFGDLVGGIITRNTGGVAMNLGLLGLYVLVAAIAVVVVARRRSF